MRRSIFRPPAITRVRYTAASADEAETGLLGFISCVLNGALRLDGITLRRTANGRHALSFPGHRDGGGYQHFYIEPLNDRVRCEIEHQIFRALGLLKARQS